MERIDLHLFDCKLFLREQTILLVYVYGWGGRRVGTVCHLIFRVKILEVYEGPVLYLFQDGFFQWRGKERVAK